MVTEVKTPAKSALRQRRSSVDQDLALPPVMKFKVYDSPLKPRHFTLKQLRRAVEAARTLSAEE